MLGLKRLGPMDLCTGVGEAMILRSWDIFSILEYIGNLGEGNRVRNNLGTWDHPLENMYKLNFDGASKGNLG